MSRPLVDLDHPFVHVARNNPPTRPDGRAHWAAQAHGRNTHGIPRNLRSQPRRPGGLLAPSCAGHQLVAGTEHRAGRLRGAVLPLVPRRCDEHVLQRAGSACGGRPRGSARPALRQPGHQHHADPDLRRTADRGRPFRRCPHRSWCRGRRPGGAVDADDSGGRDRDARLRADRGGAFGGLRRFRGPRTRSTDRRCAAESHPVRVVRDRTEPSGCLQAVAR